MAPSSESDYGDELDWDDEEVQSQLINLEKAPAPPSAAQPQPAYIEVTIAGEAALVQPSEQSSSQVEDLAAAVQELAEGGGPSLSLWEKFRKRRGWGGLSVSDLVGPSWCEVQHSYRLSSKSHLPPEERPATIVTSTGATIPVSQNRTVAREVVLDKGRAVHKVLEKAAMGDAEEVKVAIGQKEEWWALRILNTMVCLETLIATGLAREVPVVGFVGDFLVFGVIDEVDRRELPSPTASTSAAPSTPTKNAVGSKTSTTPAKDDQAKLERFFTPVSSPSKKGKEKAANQETTEPDHVDTQKWGFCISDSKTRYNPSMPPKNESRASRLQLMLYHRLLSSLLTPTPSAGPSDASPSPPPDCPAPFDWPRLYAHLSLDPSSPFTEPFLTSIQPVLVGSSLESSLSSVTTLEQFVVALQRYGETLGARLGVRGPFQPELEIHYRLRNSQRKWKPKKKSRKEREDEDLKKAIAESLSASEGGRDVARAGEDEEDLARALAMSLEQSKLEPAVVEEIVGLEAHNPVEPAQDSAMEELDVLAEAIPFVADVSLLVPPREDDALAPTPPASPSPGADVSSLPTNSQAAPPPAPPADSRYNLRRRRPTTTPSAENVNPNILPPISPSTPPSKRLRPAPPPLTPAAPPPRAESPTPPPSPPEELLEGTIIGTERFVNDPAELSAWLGDVTSLWKGEREPRGVSLEQTSRCRTCEFEEGCEWRQAKASEALAATRARNRAAAERKR